LFEEFPRWPATRGLFDRAVSPAVDVIENPDGYTVECELPGMDQEDIDVSISSGVLTIKGEKKGRRESNGRKIYREETWEGSLQRTLSLPQNVEEEKVEASYKDGVLRINLAKKETANPSESR
jgi:HSP20 family protein